MFVCLPRKRLNFPPEQPGRSCRQRGTCLNPLICRLWAEPLSLKAEYYWCYNKTYEITHANVTLSACVCVCVASGGRDRRGGPVLTFPSRSNHDRIRTDDLRRLIAYLAGIPRLHFHTFCSCFVCASVACLCFALFFKERGGIGSSKQTPWVSRWLGEETREGVEQRTWREIVQQQLARCSDSAA